MQDLKKKFQIVFFQQEKKLLKLFIKDITSVKAPSDIKFEEITTKPFKILSTSILETPIGADGFELKSTQAIYSSIVNSITTSEIFKTNLAGSNKIYADKDVQVIQDENIVKIKVEGRNLIFIDDIVKMVSESINKMLLGNATHIYSDITNLLIANPEVKITANDSVIVFNADREIVCITTGGFGKISVLGSVIIKIDNCTTIKTEKGAPILCLEGPAYLRYFEPHTLSEMEDFSLFSLKYKVFN